MALVRFEAGERIFAEGDVSDCVLKIVRGEVTALKDLDGRQVPVGKVRSGEYVGEMGVIQGLPRGATIRAEGSVEAERYGREDFLQMISADQALSFSLLQRLSQRLNVLDRDFAVETTLPPRAQPAAFPLLKAASAELRTALPGGERPIESFPFVVGRVLSGGEQPPLPVDLALADRPPYRLCPAHFRIERLARGYQVRDLESQLGTSVNGVCLGQDFGADVAPLYEGDNEIVAGGLDSPFHFTLAIEG